MRFSRYFAPTLKEAPSDAEVISLKLLVRTGMVRKLTSGIYNYLPMGLRSLKKIENIVRDEMNKAGALELLMPTVQPADLWQESGRWEFYGKELLRFKDRHDRDYCLGPTHEEVITDIVRKEVKSYRHLPVNLYQIQTKFRDEIRPRFGLMRGREFIMKDAYSFDRDDAGADISYKAMYDAYSNIFKRLGLKFKPVEADTGSIGGSFSHEFMVLAETGEDVIASCTACHYAANVERAIVKTSGAIDTGVPPVYGTVDTPGSHNVQEVADFLKVSPEAIVKTILLNADGRSIAVLVRGGREVNIPKVKTLLGADVVEFATPEEVTSWTNAPVGFAGPANINVSRVIADNELSLREGWVTGANENDKHHTSVSLARDAKVTEYADVRNIAEGDPCPACGGVMEFPRGIEVGHVFKLGTKYSKSLKAMYLDENGKEQLIMMGCYGIGVSRILASCIEQNNDEGGIVFPPPVAPFEVALLNLDPKNGDVCAKVEELYAEIGKTELEVLMDDRDERPGVKFKDADLIGLPLQLVVGGKSLARGVIEAKDRKTGEKTELPVEGFAEAFAAWKTAVYAGWGM
jgi:prolyl-tRNA synthetase